MAKNHSGWRVAGVAGALVLGAGAGATDLLPTLYNTGHDGTHTNLAAGSIDPHYVLTVNANGAGSDAIVEDNLPGSWLNHTTYNDSRWIGPTRDASAGVADGDYVYRYTLDLTGYVGSTAQFAGRWSTDNNGVIYVNGNATSNTTGVTAFEAWHAFSLGPNLFTGGVNTIDFHVYNEPYAGANPSGLRVEWQSGSATPVPEPFTMALGAAALGMAFRRRR